MSKSILDCPVQFDRASFFDLVSLSAAGMISRQNRLGELVIGDSGWSCDIRNRQITFGERSFTAGMLGSENDRDHTWLWAWAATESNIPELTAAPSRHAKRALKDVAEFTTGKFMLEDELHTAHNLAMVSCAASDKPVCYYRCPYDGGAVFMQLEGLPEAVFAPVSQPAFVRTFMEVISGFYCDHRLLAAGFLHMNGTPFTEDGMDIIADFGGSRICFAFEEVGGLHRTVNISSV